MTTNNKTNATVYIKAGSFVTITLDFGETHLGGKNEVIQADSKLLGKGDFDRYQFFFEIFIIFVNCFLVIGIAMNGKINQMKYKGKTQALL